MLENNDSSSIHLNDVHEKYKKLTTFLVENGITITLMESCTSGFIASLITDTEGASSVFKGSCVTYSNEAKIKEGVDENIIKHFGVYSRETAVEMVRACVEKFPAEIGIGITGSFGNVDPANKDSVPGKVFIAVSAAKKIQAKEFSLPVNISRFESKLCVADLIFEMITAQLDFN